MGFIFASTGADIGLFNILRSCVPIDMQCINLTWRRHQMETFSALLALCVGNSPVPGEFPTQRPETRSFDIFFDLRLNKRLVKQSRGWWFEMRPWSLWRHSNEYRCCRNCCPHRDVKLVNIYGNHNNGGTFELSNYCLFWPISCDHIQT